MSVTATETATIRDEILGRIRELRPLFEANAARTESDRRVVEDNITALRDADAFRIMVPKRFGGLETDIRTKFEVSREVAMGCGSTAWVTALMNVCAFFTSLGNEQLQHDVWGTDPDARISGVFNPTATTKRVDGGYVVNGSWNWTSGCLHSDWAFLGVPLVDEAGEFVQPAMALMPYAELEIEDTWFTTGMRGTAQQHRARPRRVRARPPVDVGARSAHPRLRHAVQGRGAVPLGFHPGRRVDPRRAAARTGAGGTRLRDREGAQARHRLHRVRVATRRADVPTGDRQGGDARRHRPPVRLPRRGRHRRRGTGRPHDDLRRAGTGADGHRPRRRVGARSDPGAVLGPRRVELRRSRARCSGGGATPRSPAATPS